MQVAATSVSKFSKSLALQNYYAALKIEQESNDKTEVAATYIVIAWVHSKGNYPDAIINFKTAIKIASEISDTLIEAKGYWGLAETYSVMGNYSEAIKNSYRALKLFELIGQTELTIYLYSNLGYTFEKQNNFPEALNAYNKSLQLAEKTGNKIGIADASSSIGQLFYNNDNYNEAYKNYADALIIYKELDNQYRIAYSIERIGDLMEKKGDLLAAQDSMNESVINYNDAYNHYREALSIYSKTEYKVGEAELNTLVGNILLKLKNLPAAEKYLFDAIKISKAIESKEAIKNAYKGLSDYYYLRGDFKSAIDNYKLFIGYRAPLL